MKNSETFDNKEETVRVISFQSKEVWDIVVSTGEYIADPSLSRERRDYKLDIEQLGGKQPVWGFISKYENGFSPIDFLDSMLLERFRCEMSLNQDGLQRFIVMELDVPVHLVKKGLTHNAYDYAVVFPEIQKDWLISIGKVEIFEHYESYDYRYLVPVHIYKETSSLLYSFVPMVKEMHLGIKWGGKVTVKPIYNGVAVISENDVILYKIKVSDREPLVIVQAELTHFQKVYAMQKFELYFRSMGVEDYGFTLAKELSSLV